MLALATRRTLALLLGASALMACPPKGGGPDTPADTDTDPDPDPDTDTETAEDTGIASLYWTGTFETAAGEFSSATLGFTGYGLVEKDWVCTISGTLAYEGDAPAGCPGCEWAFDLSGVSASDSAGAHCDGFGDTIFADNAIDAYFDWSWGFAPSYTYYGSDGTAYPLAETLFINQDGTNWGLFAFNYGSSFQMIEGDATSLSILAQASDGTANIYYYYYR